MKKITALLALIFTLTALFAVTVRAEGEDGGFELPAVDIEDGADDTGVVIDLGGGETPADSDTGVVIDLGGEESAGPEAAPSEPNDLTLDRVVDNADLLTDDEEADLRARIGEFTAEHGMDFVIVTVDGTGADSITEFADDFYDYNGYGVGPENDGALFALDMGERDWWLSTTGSAISAYTDYGIESIGEEVVPYLSDGDYYNGFVRLIDVCCDYADSFEEGSPVDDYGGYNDGNGSGYVVERSERPFSIVPYLICLGVGLIAALVVTSGMKAKMKTAVAQKRASQYMLRDSLDMLASEDTFLYTHTSRTARNTDSGSRSGGSGGGSSVHIGSSGASHGGGGGQF